MLNQTFTTKAGLTNISNITQFASQKLFLVQFVAEIIKRKYMHLQLWLIIYTRQKNYFEIQQQFTN